MLNYNQAFHQLKDQLQPLYDASEAAAICHIFMEHITGLGKLDRLTYKDKALSRTQQLTYDRESKDLVSGKPVQYVIGSAWFCGREYVVTEAVLIPRPETEELVNWIVEDHKATPKLRVLDVGTGSGCIGISLAVLLSKGIITCVDVSDEALEIASTNVQWVLSAGEKLDGAGDIRLVQLDFLDEDIRNSTLGRYDIIVSNPPYIPAKDKKAMHDNVRKHEPALALYVPDNDALLYYRHLAAFGQEHLRQEGYIYCELDAGNADACKALFEAAGYIGVETRKDMNGLWRMLRARIPAPAAS